MEPPKKKKEKNIRWLQKGIPYPCKIIKASRDTASEQGKEKGSQVLYNQAERHYIIKFEQLGAKYNNI